MLPNPTRTSQFHSSIPLFHTIFVTSLAQINGGMQLIQDLINNKSSRICTRSPSGFVLEVTSDSSGHRVVAASPVDQNLCQYFVVTELPVQGSYTIANTAATGTFLELTSPTTSAPLRLTASSRRFTDETQEWKLIFEENVNGWLVYCRFFPWLF